MDALPVHQVMSYHPPVAAGSYKGQRTICLQASMPFTLSPVVPAHTPTPTHSHYHLPEDSTGCMDLSHDFIMFTLYVLYRAASCSFIEKLFLSYSSICSLNMKMKQVD